MKLFIDGNSTTKPLKFVIENLTNYMNEYFYNLNPTYQFYNEIEEKLENSRKIITQAIGAETGKIIFTSGATESNNLIITGFKSKSIITSSIEHPSVLNTAKSQKNKSRYIISSDKMGNINKIELESILKKAESPILVSIQHANQVVHTIQNIKKIGNICKKYSAYFHVDATQSFGRIPIYADSWNVDAITLSSHKCHGPKGVGVLWLKENITSKKLIEPIMKGGSQEYGLRPGTLNIPSILAFKDVVADITKNQDNIYKTLDILGKKLLAELKEKCGGIILNGSQEQRLPGGLHLTIEGIDTKSLLLGLPEIQASTGMACSQELKDPILEALGLDGSNNKHLRIQFCRDFCNDNLDILVNILVKRIIYLRNKWIS